MSGRFAFAVAVYLRRAGETLLVHHKRYGLWLPVGGEVEPGEAPRDAAARETREETGFVIEPAKLYRLGYEEHAAGDKGTHGCFSYVASAPRIPTVTLSAEHYAYAWAPDDAPDDAYPKPENVRRYLAEIRALAASA